MSGGWRMVGVSRRRSWRDAAWTTSNRRAWLAGPMGVRAGPELCRRLVDLRAILRQARPVDFDRLRPIGRAFGEQLARVGAV